MTRDELKRQIIQYARERIEHDGCDNNEELTQDMPCVLADAVLFEIDYKVQAWRKMNEGMK